MKGTLVFSEENNVGVRGWGKHVYEYFKFYLDEILDYESGQIILFCGSSDSGKTWFAKQALKEADFLCSKEDLIDGKKVQLTIPPSSDVYVVDEAQAVDTTSLVQLLELHKSGKKIILIAQNRDSLSDALSYCENPPLNIFNFDDLSFNRSDKKVAQKKIKYAVSERVYAPGLITVTSEGIINYDPKPAETDLLIKLFDNMGYERVEMEPLIKELYKSGISLKASRNSNNHSFAEVARIKMHTQLCDDIGRVLMKTIIDHRGDERLLNETSRKT